MELSSPASPLSPFFAILAVKRDATSPITSQGAVSPIPITEEVEDLNDLTESDFGISNARNGHSPRFDEHPPTNPPTATARGVFEGLIDRDSNPIAKLRVDLSRDCSS